MNKQIKYQNALTKAGYLKKESPGMVKIFQSRYYSFRDKGRALIWFKKQPSNIEERPQGFIVVEEIEKVEPDEKDKYIFYIHYPERVFKLKAESSDDRQEWIEAIETVKDFLKESQEKPAQKSTSPSKKEGWRWENVTTDLAKKIQIENQQIFINDSEVNDEELSAQKSREILKTKGLVQNTANQDLIDRIAMGFLYKKGKFNKITQWKLRWFFMVSEYNLRDESDGRFLTFSQLPPWVQTNTIYYFNPKEGTEAKGNIKVRDITQIEMELNEKPYRMVMKVGGQSERQYHLGSRFMIEIKKWENSIKSIQKCFRAEVQAEEKKLNTLKNEPVTFETEAIQQNNPAYFVVKKTLALVFPSKQIQDYSQAKYIRYDAILKYTNDKTILSIVMTPTPITIEFKDEATCTEAYNKLREAIETLTKKVEEEATDASRPEKQIVYDTKNDEEDNGYLSKKLNKRMSRVKNYYSLASMEISPTEQPKKQQEGFWGRLSLMFCVSREI